MPRQGTGGSDTQGGAACQAAPDGDLGAHDSSCGGHGYTTLGQGARDGHDVAIWILRHAASRGVYPGSAQLGVHNQAPVVRAGLDFDLRFQGQDQTGTLACPVTVFSDQAGAGVGGTEHALG